MKKITIIIADDHPIFRSGVREILSKAEDLQLVAEADNGLTAYQSILSHLPEVAVLDLEMPVLNGLDVCKKVLSDKHQTQFVILTMHKDKQFFQDAMNSGVKGYLLKDTASYDLLECIREVAKGNEFVSQSLRYLQHEHQQIHSSPEMEKVATLLTPTEKIILKLISSGKTSVEIASMLFVSPNTIENHRSNMSKKLQLEGKNSLMKFSMNLKGEL